MATVGILELEALPIAVPGDRVVTVAIEVEPDRVERPRICWVKAARASASTGKTSRVGRRRVPPGCEARLGQPAVVHRDLSLVPRQHGDQLGEHQVGAMQPPRGVVDPGVLVEPRAGDAEKSASTDGSSKANRHCCQMRSDSASCGIPTSSRIERTFASRLQQGSVARGHQRGAGRQHFGHHAYSSGVVIEIEDPLDPRLADYRGLRERGKESDEYFIVEGLTAIERLLTSDVPGSLGAADAGDARSPR